MKSHDTSSSIIMLMHRIAGILTFTIGIVVMGGWFFNIEVLKKLDPGLVTMKANTALCFVLAGLALWFQQNRSAQKRRRILSVTLSIAVMIIGFMTLVEYFAGWDLRIDEILFTDNELHQTSAPGRMAPITAVNFLLLGLALAGLNRKTFSVHLSQALASVVMLSASLALIGYAYGVQALYHVFPYTSIAIHTAVTFVILGMGILAARPHEGLMRLFTSHYVGSVVARRLIPLAVVPFFLGWLRLKGQQAGWYDLEFGLALVITTMTASFILLVLVNTSLLNRADAHRKRVEDELSESDTFKELLLSTAQLGIAMVYEDGTVFYTNRYLQELAGTIVIGKRCWDVYKDDGAQCTDCPLIGGIIVHDTKTMETNSVFGGRTFEISHVGLMYQGRKAILEVYHDITEKKQTQQELRASERKYRQLHESMRDSFVQTDMTGKIVDSNTAYREMLGYTAEELSTIRYQDITPVKWAAMEEKIVEEQIIPLGYSDVYEKEYRKKDGTIIPVELRAFILLDDAGRPEGMWGIVRDITKRKQAEEHMRLLSSSVNAAANAIVITDRDGIIQSVNPAFTQLTGYSFEEVLHENPRILKSGLQDTQFYEELWQTITHGKVWKGTLINKRKDGTLYHEEQTITPIKNEHGEITHFISIKEDISERERAEQELLSAKEQAEQADRLKDAFIANISHEIRTPLNIMFGFIELIRLGGHAIEPSELEEYFDSIHRGGHRLMRTVDQILNISLLTTGIYNTQYQTIDVAGQLEALVVDLQPLAQEKNLHLELAAERRPRIDGDLYSFIQTVSNLLDNAIKFTNTGGVFVHVFEEQDAVKVSIRDTGIGIAEEYLPSLYQAFSQEVGGYTRPYEGVGLGMALVKRYMDVNKGHIEVHSEKNKGTEFVLTFPIVTPEEKH